MKNSLINTFVSAPIFYAMFSFFLAEFNIGLWTEEARFVMLSFIVVVFFFSSLHDYIQNGFYQEENDDEQSKNNPTIR